MDVSQTPAQLLGQLRDKGPLVHNITNFVVMNSTANALLAVGASPIMAHALEEMEEMASLADALVINIGTLSSHWIEAMRRAGTTARERGAPIVLDPVGAGASRLRTETCLTLLNEVSPGIVRGNGSEIMALAGAAATTKGVDSTAGSREAGEAARELAGRFACVVVVSGEVDIITDGTREITVHGGHALMPKVTGMGCTCSALVGAFAAVTDSGFEAAVGAMAAAAAAGEAAGRDARGPGSFQVGFLDALYRLAPEQIDTPQRLS